MSKRLTAFIVLLMMLPFPLVFSLFMQGTDPKTDMLPEYTIGFVETATEDSGKAYINEIVYQVCDRKPYQLLAIAADRDQNSQIEAIRSLIAYQVDLIIFSPVVARGWNNVLAEAEQVGITILTLDKTITENDSSMDISYIVFDYYEGAASLAERYLENSEQDAVVLELYGTVGGYSSLRTTKGFRDVFRERTQEKDGIITYSLGEDFLHSRAKEATQRIIKTDSGLDVILSHGDAMTLGAVAAIEEAGLVPGEDILIFSIAGSTQVYELMSAGRVNYIAYCDVSQLSKALADGLVQILEEDDAYLQVVLPTQLLQGGAVK